LLILVQGQFFPFFVTALLLLILLPTTYTSLFKRKGSFLEVLIF
jgi:hypothetical protein